MPRAPNHSRAAAIFHKSCNSTRTPHVRGTIDMLTIP